MTAGGAGTYRTWWWCTCSWTPATCRCARGTREKEGIPCAYAILEDGGKVLLHLALGSRESYDAWLSFLHDLVARGLREPVLIISDGQPGLKKALEEVFPRVCPQRCLLHKMRNIWPRCPGAYRRR